MWERPVRGQWSELAGKGVHCVYVGEEQLLKKMKQWGLVLLSEIMGITDPKQIE